MNEVSIVGLDLAKRVFQVHAAGSDGGVVLRRKLSRGQVITFFTELPKCTVAMEACATAHYWAREIGKLGHEVRLIPPAYVKPFVKRQKNDAADAEAIVEAATRPSMRFVVPKTESQQACSMPLGYLAANFALKGWAMKIAKRRGLRKARVALARRLAVIMHAMLRDGTLFEA